MIYVLYKIKWFINEFYELFTHYMDSYCIAHVDYIGIAIKNNIYS